MAIASTFRELVSRFSGLAALLFAVSTLSHSSANGQSAPQLHSVVWQRTPLETALPEIVRLTGIDLIYDDETVAGRTGHCVARQALAEELLRCVVHSSGLDYIRTSTGTYIVILPAVSTRPRSGLSGRVVDATTGRPLALANVLLIDANTGTATAANGEFVVSGVLPGRHRVMATYVGYESASMSDVDLIPGENRYLEIMLRPASLSTEPVVIDGLQQRLSHRIVEQVLRNAEVGERDHEVRDVMRAATSIQGVSTYRSLAELHVQGGSTGEHATLLDGTPVRDPVSFGRYLGAFSPLAIGQMTVHKSGFDARHGSHLAGVLALQHDLDSRGVVANLDPVSMNLRIAGRRASSTGREVTGMVTARTSIWGQYRSAEMTELLSDWTRIDPLLASFWTSSPGVMRMFDVHDLHPEVSFSDLHAGLRLRADAFNTFTASLFRAGNAIRNGVAATSRESTPARLQINDDYDWTNWAAQARMQRLIGTRTFAAIRIAASNHDSGYAYRASYDTDPYDPSVAYQIEGPTIAYRHSDQRHHITEWTAGVEASHSMAPWHTLDLGVSTSLIDASITASGPFARALSYDTETWQFGSHVNSTFAVGVRTTIDAGMRGTYLPARHTLYAEPRLAVRHDGDRFAVRLATGLYRQFIHQFELSSTGASAAIPAMLFWLPAERSASPQRAIHTALDVLVVPAGPVTIQVDGYFKHLSRLLAIDYRELVTAPHDHAASDFDDFVESGNGYALGGGLRVQYEAGSLRTSVGYNHVRSRRAFSSRADGAMLSVPWEEPHRFTADMRLSILPTLGIRAVWQAAHGRAWAFRRAYYDYLPHMSRTDVPLEMNGFQPGEPRLPPFERLDVSLTYSRRWAGVDVQSRISLINVLDRRNIFDRSITSAGELDSARHLPGRQPAVSLTLRR